MPEITQSNSLELPRKINWKNILIILVIVILLIGGGVGIWFLLNQPTTQPPTKTPTSTSSAKTATPSAQTDKTEDWKTYENDNFAYQIKIPLAWFISDTYCEGEKRSNQVFIYDRPLSDDCGVEAVAKLGAKIAIYVGPLHDKFPDIFPDCKETQDSIEIAGLTAIKYYSPEEPCTQPGFSTIKIFFNYKENGYQIELLNKDFKGNYDPLYNQILSTFKFID